MGMFWDPSADYVDPLKVLMSTAETLARGDNLSLGGILEIVYQQVTTLICEADLCVALYDAAKDVFHSGISRIRGNRIDCSDGSITWPPPASDIFARTVVQSGMPSQPSDQNALHSASLIGVQMAFGRKSLGVILVCTEPNGHGTAESKVAVLRALGDQAAVALAYRALVDERDQTLKLLREQEHKGIALERLSAVNAVAADFAHKMNNLAGTIPARVALVREYLAPTDPNYSRIMRYLDGINDDAEQLLRSAHEIRSATQVPRVSEPVDITQVINAAIRRIPVPAGIEVVRKFDVELPSVRASGAQLADVLENLVRNAIEAVGNAGTVTVVAKARSEGEQRWVNVDVSDTGQGIAPEQLTRVFDLFYSTKLGGTGFGLWRAKTIVQSLGGQIRVSSASAQGTTFTLLLPWASEPEN